MTKRRGKTREKDGARGGNLQKGGGKERKEEESEDGARDNKRRRSYLYESVCYVPIRPMAHGHGKKLLLKNVPWLISRSKDLGNPHQLE